MDVSHILSAIDAEIARLQQAREAVAALNGTSPVPQQPAPGRRGRPKGSKNAVAAAAVPEPPARKRKRNLSPEGRKRIQEAKQRRWADRRKGTNSDK